MKPMTEEQAEQWKNTRDKGLLNEAFKLFLTSFFILFLVGAAWQSMTKGFESLEWWSMF